jgi:site-specific DNA-methyltransferase (adenine-specific)
LCGDSTKKESFAALLGKEKPNLCVTDPPYGVNYDPDWRNRADRANGVKIGDRAVGRVENDHRANWEETWRLLPSNVCYVWHGGLHGGVVQNSLEVVGYKLKAQIVWIKTRSAISRGNYRWQHEPSFYMQKEGTEDGWRFAHEQELAAYVVREGSTHSWRGDRRQSTVWFIEHLKSDTGHGTQKPVECMRRPILNNSAPGETVLDPFLGSGTTLIACEMEGRNCRGIELDAGYVEVIIERWQAFVGAEAVLEGSGGKTLEQIKRARRSGRAKGESDAPGPGRKPVRRAGRKLAAVAPAVAK